MINQLYNYVYILNIGYKVYNMIRTGELIVDSNPYYLTCREVFMAVYFLKMAAPLIEKGLLGKCY